MLPDKNKYMIWNCVKFTQSFLKKKTSILYARRGFAAAQGRTECSIYYKSSRISNTLDAVSHKIS